MRTGMNKNCNKWELKSKNTLIDENRNKLELEEFNKHAVYVEFFTEMFRG